MGGRGGKAPKAIAQAQKATNARTYENMNEAQLNQELEKVERAISAAEKARDGVSLSTAEQRAFADAFPLGAGFRSDWKKYTRDMERTVANAGKYVEKTKELDYLEKKRDSLNDYLKRVQGTGQTAKEIVNAKVNESVAASERVWKKGEAITTPYGKMTVQNSGDYQIRTSEGTSFIYQGGKQIGMTSSVKKAKAYVEALEKRKRGK